MLATIGLKTAIWNNNIRSFLLLALYPPLIAVIVWAVVFAGLYGMQINPNQHDTRAVYKSAQYGDLAYSKAGINSGAPYVNKVAAQATTLTLQYSPYIIGGITVWFVIALLIHAHLIHAMSGAHAVDRLDEPELYNMLEALCISRGLPMPKLSVIETHARNAFASGISDSSYEITVTRGLLNALRPDEVEAVLAHELTHIINRDVRLLIISVIFVGMFGFLAQTMWRILRGMSRSRSSRTSKGSGQIMLVLFIINMVLFLGYLATLLTRLALSRRREYMADAGAIELTKNPEALIRALQRIAGREDIPDVTADIRMMCLHNRQPFLGLFSTHPTLPDRLAEIAAIGGVGQPTQLSLPPAGPEESFQRQSDDITIPARHRIRSRQGWHW